MYVHCTYSLTTLIILSNQQILGASDQSAPFSDHFQSMAVDITPSGISRVSRNSKYSVLVKRLD